MKPIKNETPAVYADRIGSLYALKQSESHKKDYGQYLTPEPVAEYMGGLYHPPSGLETIRILDPGTGSGVLCCAAIQSIANNPQQCRRIELVCYEHDEGLQPQLILSLKYAQKWLSDKNITLEYDIKTADFVLENAHYLGSQLTFDKVQPEQFDLIISNPPYFKLNKADARAQAAAFVVHGQPNIYSIFMSISAYMLKPEAELIYIVPRSFAAGPYFRLFRQRFFEIMLPEHIHLFGSRKDTFNRDEILQEHLIIKAKREKHSASQTVTISTSAGIRGLTTADKRTVPLNEVINMNTENKYMFIPTCDADDEIINLVNSWDGNLHAYGMEISTGPVVPFRATEFITDDDQGTAPLLWMQNVKAMQVIHPVPTRKAQFIICNDKSAYLMLSNKNYVLLRRFSAKEEERRLVAAPFLSKNFTQHESIGFENHVNYIYKPKGDLTEAETYGVAAILNCRILDSYFRTYNGNTQVSSTELRATPLPPLQLIQQIGKHIIQNKLSNGLLDDYVSQLLIGGQKQDGKTRRSTRNS